MALFKISKGQSTNLPATMTEGFCYWCCDTGLWYVDYKDTDGTLKRKALNAKDAETLTGASLSTTLDDDNSKIPTSKAVLDELGTKVDKVDGKGLSTNDYTTDEKNKLASINLNTWVRVYDSGEITAEVNSFSDIDITEYKSIMVAVKCVNTTNTVNTRAGAVIFTGNGQDYAFNNIFNNLLKNGTTTSGAFASFKIVDGFIICETALRAISATGILSDEEGAGFDTLAPISGGLIRCTNALTRMAVSSAAQSASHFYGVGSRVIVWGCKA